MKITQNIDSPLTAVVVFGYWIVVNFLFFYAFLLVECQNDLQGVRLSFVISISVIVLTRDSDVWSLSPHTCANNTSITHGVSLGICPFSWSCLQNVFSL